MAEHQLHPNQVGRWKQQLLTEGCDIFSRRSRQAELEAAETREAELHEQTANLDYMDN